MCSDTMLSLHELLSRHRHLLLIDSSSSRIQVGFIRPDQQAWTSASEEAGVSIFTCVEEILAGSGVSLGEVEAFVFCEGPGSVLGIRTAAVAIRTWQALKTRPCYAYGSLRLVANCQLQSGRRDFSVIADARRQTWHRAMADHNGTLGPIERVAPDQLSGPLLMPEDFRHWSTLPPAVQLVPYSVSAMLWQTPTLPLFHEAPEPDAFLHEEPSYVTWTPQIHRAPN